MQDDVINMQHN